MQKGLLRSRSPWFEYKYISKKFFKRKSFIIMFVWFVVSSKVQTCCIRIYLEIVLALAVRKEKLFVLKIVLENEKVEIRKQFFSGWDIKNVEPKARLFFMSNPVKNSFQIETFPYENKILRAHNIFVKTRLLHLFKSRRAGKPLFTALVR